ncbi:MAG TPA: hypothetical protein VJC16_00860 [Candidatus Nanoarchaeia archaeon]|nr:hypothetical protein [Candidatus Nanoarchaeia archaeon]
MEPADRQTALKLRIADILHGEYHQEEDWAGHYVAVGEMRAARANVIGIVVGKEETIVTIDDGSGAMPLRNFSRADLFQGIDVGDTILVIGRPREYGGERYLAADIVKRADRRWLEVRRQEIGEQRLPAARQGAETSPAEQMMGIIRRLDKGEGADVSSVIREAGSPHAELVMQGLLKSGDIFQNRPGRVKILE